MSVTPISICLTCLCTTRNVFPIQDELFFASLTLLKLSDPSKCRLCWECYEAVRRAKQFREKALKAHAILLGQCIPTKIPLTSLGCKQLKDYFYVLTEASTPYSIYQVENQPMHINKGVPIVPDENLKTYSRISAETTNSQRSQQDLVQSTGVPITPHGFHSTPRIPDKKLKTYSRISARKTNSQIIQQDLVRSTDSQINNIHEELIIKPEVIKHDPDYPEEVQNDPFGIDQNHDPYKQVENDPLRVYQNREKEQNDQFGIDNDHDTYEQMKNKQLGTELSEKNDDRLSLDIVKSEESSSCDDTWGLGKKEKQSERNVSSNISAEYNSDYNSISSRIKYEPSSPVTDAETSHIEKENVHKDIETINARQEEIINEENAEAKYTHAEENINEENVEAKYTHAELNIHKDLEIKYTQEESFNEENVEELDPHKDSRRKDIDRRYPQEIDIHNEIEEVIYPQEEANIHKDIETISTRGEIDLEENLHKCKIRRVSEVEIMKVRQNVAIAGKTRQCRYFCYKCHELFQKKSFQEHILRHTEAAGEFVCDVCEMRFASEASLIEHQATKYRVITCNTCSVQFTRYRAFRMHYEKQHDTTDTACCICGEIFPNVGLWRQHMLKHKAYEQCDVCNKFIRKDCIKRHALLHLPQPLVRCEECGKEFAGQYKLDVHTRFHHARLKVGEAYCVECDKQFINKQQYAAHVQSSVHKPWRRLQCKFCKKRFRCRADLRGHTKSCHNYYICQQCFREFTSAKGLRSHVTRMHEPMPKDKICDYCGRGFKNMATLRQHIYAHMNMRPYKCRLCDSSFNYNASLYSHTQHVHEKKNKYIRTLDKKKPGDIKPNDVK